MTPRILVVHSAPRMWEVRVDDDHKTLLGTFQDQTSKDIFLDGLRNLLASGGNHPAVRSVSALSPVHQAA